jgi:SAM-dependent methyltransferase
VHQEAYSDGRYLERNATWHAEDSAWKARQCQALLERLDLRPSSICDVGCGAGGVIASMRDAYPDAELHGFDISPTAIGLAREQHAGVRFSVGVPGGNYDLMLVMDVLEHIEDCFGFARDLTSRADMFLFNIPLEMTCLSLLRNGLMPHRDALGHIHYFNKDTAVALLTDTGYEIIASRYIPSVVDFAARDPKTRLLTAMQRSGFRFAPDLSVLILGGYSLLVAARSRRDALLPSQ